MRLNTISADTAIDAVIKQIEILRRLNIGQRADMTFQLSDNLRQIVEAGVRQRHPDWDDRAVKRGILRLTIGEHLFQEIFADAEAS